MTLTQDQRNQRRRSINELIPKTPFIGVLDRYDPDEVTLRLPFRADLSNDGTYYHAGAVQTHRIV